MKDIKTIEQARAHRYGTWAGNPKGHTFREGYCIAEFVPNERGGLPRQCGSRPQEGSVWCKNHDPDVIESKAKAFKKDFDSRQEKSNANERRAKSLGKRLGDGTFPHYNSARRSKDSGYTEHIVVPFDLIERLLKDLNL